MTGALRAINENFDFVLIGYAIMGTFTGFYCAACAIMARKAKDFNESLEINSDDSEDVANKKRLERIILGVLGFLSLFPVANIFLGIGLGIAFVHYNNPSNFEARLLVLFTAFAGLVGWIAISMGLIPLDSQ